MTDELVKEYSTYIYGIAKRFRNYRYKDDLFQAGYIGLMKAFQKYDASKGAKFTTYAYLSIMGEMCKLVREDKGIKVNYHLSRLSLEVEKVSQLLAQKLNRYPTLKEIAEILDKEEVEIIDALTSTSVISSTDEMIYRDEKEMSLYDVIPNKEVSMDTLVTLRDSINHLTEEERIIFEKSIYYDCTQQEIADILGINQVQVSRKLQKIKEKVYSKVA